MCAFLTDPTHSDEDKTTGAHSSDPSHQNWKLQMRNHSWRPSMDIYETDEALVVRLEIAGMQEEDFEIAISGRKLTIQGNRPDIPEKRAYHQMEIHYGEFSLEIDLPFPINAEKSEAQYRNGFLHVRLPKEQPRSIPLRK